MHIADGLCGRSEKKVLFKGARAAGQKQLQFNEFLHDTKVEMSRSTQRVLN
jgi:hypothetical protein